MVSTKLLEILKDGKVHQFDWFECYLDPEEPCIVWWPIGRHNEPVFSDIEDFCELV